ncbi:hypothetical protein ACR2R6_13360 [Methylocaldum gracile subsp. desertum]|uniref:hypothetical protein n=1 Tax=Methylocaldum sp. GT1BW TaxID=3438964 RepID=UPI003D9FC325
MNKPKLPEHLTPLPPELRTYQAAKQFSVAAGVIEKGTRIPDSMMFAVQPFITCAAFSIELYLKCMLLVEGASNVHGHKLQFLFSMLTQKSKDNILFYLRGAYANLELPCSFMSHGLTSIDNAFVEWRYVHEKDYASINLEFLRKFAWACQMHIRYLKPEWFGGNGDMPKIGS